MRFQCFIVFSEDPIVMTSQSPDLLGHGQEALDNLAVIKHVYLRNQWKIQPKDLGHIPTHYTQIVP